MGGCCSSGTPGQEYVPTGDNNGFYQSKYVPTELVEPAAPKDISSRDKEALKVGKRWLGISKAASLRDQSEHPYNKYCEQKVSNEQKQCIDKAVGEAINYATAKMCSASVTKLFSELGGTNEGLLRSTLTRVLTGLAVRNTTPYQEGSAILCYFLMNFMSEEEAFWVLCVVTEKLRGMTYNSDMFLWEEAAVAAAVKSFPELAKQVGESFERTVRGMCHLSFPLAFVGSLSLQNCIAVMDQFLKFGDLALIWTTLIITHNASLKMKMAENQAGGSLEMRFGSAMCDTEGDLTPKDLALGLARTRIDKEKAQQLIDQHRATAKVASALTKIQKEKSGAEAAEEKPQAAAAVTSNGRDHGKEAAKPASAAVSSKPQAAAPAQATPEAKKQPAAKAAADPASQLVKADSLTTPAQNQKKKKNRRRRKSGAKGQ